MGYSWVVQSQNEGVRMDDLDITMGKAARMATWLRLRETAIRMLIGVFCVLLWQWGAYRVEDEGLCDGAVESVDGGQTVEAFQEP